MFIMKFLLTNFLFILIENVSKYNFENKFCNDKKYFSY